MRGKSKEAPFPVISIIIPCYNQGQYLGQALDSLLLQTFENWECIIINDGSNDQTEEISISYLERDKRFHYIKKENGGLSSARNAGLRASRGDFIQLLDSDDFIETDKLQRQIQILQKFEDVDLVYSEVAYFKTDNPNILYKSFDLSNNDWLPKISGSGNNLIKELLEGNIMACNCPIFRKACVDIIGYFDERLFNFEDYDYWNRLALAGFHFKYDSTQNTKALVRLHETSMSRTTKMEIGLGLAQLKLMNSLVQQGRGFLFDKKSILEKKKKATLQFLADELKLVHLNMVFNRLEKFRLKFHNLIPMKYKFYFLMFNLKDMFSKLSKILLSYK